MSAQVLLNAFTGQVCTGTGSENPSRYEALSGKESIGVTGQLANGTRLFWEYGASGEDGTHGPPSRSSPLGPGVGYPGLTLTES
jgi:hypothetical protein